MTENLKNILKYGQLHAPSAAVDIIKNNGEVVTISGDDLLSSIEVNWVGLSESGSPVGGLATKKLTVKLSSIEQIKNLNVSKNEAYQIRFSLDFNGELYVSETFKISDFKTSEDLSEVEIVAMDIVNSLNVAYQEVYDADMFPMPASEWLEGFAAQYGVAIDGSRLPFINRNIPKPNIDNMSAKQVLSKFLEWNWSSGYANGDTIFGVPVEMSAAVDTFNRDSSSEFSTENGKLGKYGINTITLALSNDIESENFAAADQSLIDLEGAEVEIRLSGNPFIVDQAGREEYAPLILDLAAGFNYQPYIMESRALYLNLFDTFEQDGLDSMVDGSYSVPIYEYNMVYDGSLKVKVAAAIMDDAETELKWSSLSPSKRTEIRVDKVEQRIELTVETIEQQGESISENSATIQINKESIEQEVKDREWMGSELEKEIASQILQSADKVKIEFGEVYKELDGNTNNINEIKSYFDFKADGLEIGKSDSAFKVTLNNERLSFIENGAEIAYITGQTLHITSATILASITLGNHIFEKSTYSNGRTVIRRV